MLSHNTSSGLLHLVFCTSSQKEDHFGTSLVKLFRVVLSIPWHAGGLLGHRPKTRQLGLGLVQRHQPRSTPAILTFSLFDCANCNLSKVTILDTSLLTCYWPAEDITYSILMFKQYCTVNITVRDATMKPKSQALADGSILKSFRILLNSSLYEGNTDCS